MRVSSANGLLVYDRASRSTGSRNSNNIRHRQRLEVVVAEPSAELELKCEYGSGRAATAQADHQLASLGRRILWYLNGAFAHSSQSDLLVLRSGIAGQAAPGESAVGVVQHKLAAGNGGRLSCAHQTFEPGASLAAPGNFHAQSMKLFSSSNEIDLRFKGEFFAGC